MLDVVMAASGWQVRRGGGGKSGDMGVVLGRGDQHAVMATWGWQVGRRAGQTWDMWVRSLRIGFGVVGDWIG